MDIYSHGTRDEWLDFFGVSDSGTMFCDDQFVANDETKLAFLVLDHAYTGTCFTYPNRLIWRPTQHYLKTTDCHQQFTEQFVATPIHIMVQLPEDTIYTYIGVVSCHSYIRHSTFTQDDFFVDVTFWSENWLPRELWVKWGGYEAWKLIFNNEEVRVSTWAEIEPYVQRLYSENNEYHHLVLEYYDGDMLHVATSGNRVIFNYSPEPFGSGCTSRNLDIDVEDKNYVTYFVYGGHHTEGRPSQFIPKTHLIATMRQYVDTGTLSHLIHWDWNYV